MPQPVLTAMTQANCPHGGKVTFPSTATKVLIDAAPPLIVPDKGVVTGCAFTVPPAVPQPCVIGLLPQAAAKVMVEGRPVVLQSPGDLCQSAVPQGPVIYLSVQTKVIAT